MLWVTKIVVIAFTRHILLKRVFRSNLVTKSIAENGSSHNISCGLLGAYHGLNPGMGWLFAVALGMQEQKGSAVARSLVPIALGHTMAIGSVVLIATFLGMALQLMVIRYFVAAVLVGLGILCLVQHPHPRWVRMRVGFRDLTVWSFLMASARRRFDGSASALGQYHCRSTGSNGTPQSHVYDRQPAIRDARHRRPYDGLSCSHGAGRLGGLSKARPRTSP